MAERVPAERFPPGEFIEEELLERGWSLADLAEKMGATPEMVAELIKGTRAVTPEIADGLSAAFGTSAEVWLNLGRAGHQC